LRLTGIYPALFTPYDETGAISEKMLRKLVAAQVAAGVDGLYLCGGTGEGLLLSTEERKRVAEIAVQEANGRAKVLVHVGSLTTKECVDLARHAGRINADAISSVPPFYYGISLEGMAAHYAEISAACDLPLLLYNIPTAVQVTVTPDMMSRFLEVPTVSGIKFSSYHLFHMWQMLQLDSVRLAVLSGNDEVMLAALAMGAHGAIGLTLNLMPGLYRDLYRSATNHDFATARCLQDDANRVIAILLRYPVIPAAKEAMRLRGYDCGPCRAPLERLTPAQSARLFEELRQVGFLDRDFGI
jgi:N-acetylneuraminate lyase